MIVALIIFLITYILMLSFQKYRPYIALTSAAVFVVLGLLNGQTGLFREGLTIGGALSAVDYNVLLMIAGTMGLVTLFVESKMPVLLAETLISRVPNVKWAVTALALFAGVVSAFVDNVATVLMIAPIGLAISRRLKISPVPVLIAIAVSSNLQGAATMVGDTTSMLLGGAAGMNFLDFFWMNGRPGIFWGVELGALISAFALLFLFRKEEQAVSAVVETKVEDKVPTILLLGTIALLIVSSFIPTPQNEILLAIYNIRSGLICLGLAVIGIVYSCIKKRSADSFKNVLRDLDRDTLLLLFGLFIVIEGIKCAGVIDAIAELFYNFAGNNPFLLYTLIVFASVILSAFIDNIPYVATMLPVIASIAAQMNGGAGVEPYVFYFGLLIGATLGGNLTPIGASANIAAIGILRKNGETVRVRDFLRIGVPFTLAAVLTGYIYIWIVWGI